ncbi:MAG TPA: DUF3572 domain-containing protein, partial [Sphingomonas sp.]|nr:DUF3572 domain-containing protein [Sphingomonas sp.]
FERLGHDGPLIRDHKLTERQTDQLKKPVQNPREVAEIVAVQALGFVAGDPERLGLFLAETGIGPETLRTAAADPKFLGAVLDFVMRDDATVRAFAAASELHPTNIAAARQVLGDPHWERDVP